MNIKIEIINQAVDSSKKSTNLTLSIDCSDYSSLDVNQDTEVKKYPNSPERVKSSESPKSVSTGVRNPASTAISKIEYDIDTLKWIYDTEVESGLFFVWYPDLTGSWNADKDKWIIRRFKS